MISIKSIFDDNKYVVTGIILKTIRLKDEFYNTPISLDKEIENIKNKYKYAGLFTFLDEFPLHNGRSYKYYSEMDNLAVINIINYEYWYKNQIPKSTRGKLRKANINFIETKIVNLNNDFISGILEIYNETPIRRGKLFTHFNKGFEYVKSDMYQDFDKSVFIGAYIKQELVGFVKLYIGDGWSRTVNIISKLSYKDKCINNALISEAVKYNSDNNIPYLIYGKYEYIKGISDTLTLFKKNNGFKKYDIPRYYVPLNAIGYISIKIKCVSIKDIIISKHMYAAYNKIRSYWFRYNNK